MSRLIIDITQLVHWPGELTGIPRVMHELTLRYAKLPETVFVVWQPQSKDFYEINIQSTLANRGQSIHYANDSETGGSGILKNSSRLKKTVKRTARYVPGARVALTTLKIRQLTKRPVFNLQKGDNLLVMWGEMTNDYVERIKKLHAAGIKLIQVVYDVLPLVAPQYSGHSTKPMQLYNEAVVPRCELVLAISENTKKDLEHWLKQEGLERPRIEAFRLGDDFKQAKASQPKAQEFIQSNLRGSDFILCVGTVEARKNHALLYYAYKLAKHRNIELPKLVIVGRRGWKTEDIYEIITNDPETRSDFIFLHDLNDEELAWMYQNCLFSVYPSFYEGWGLPVAESLARGIPCIASNTSSIPEIAGDLVDYFSPASTDELLAGIQRLLRPAELTKAKKRVSSYKPTSWDQTFNQVNNFIKELDER